MWITQCRSTIAIIEITGKTFVLLLLDFSEIKSVKCLAKAFWLSKKYFKFVSLQSSLERGFFYSGCIIWSSSGVDYGTSFICIIHHQFFYKIKTWSCNAYAGDTHFRCWYKSSDFKFSQISRTYNWQDSVVGGIGLTNFTYCSFAYSSLNHTVYTHRIMVISVTTYPEKRIIFRSITALLDIECFVLTNNMTVLFRKGCFVCWGRTHSNKLPDKCKNDNNTQTFKNRYKRFLLHQEMN